MKPSTARSGTPSAGELPALQLLAFVGALAVAGVYARVHELTLASLGVLTCLYFRHLNTEVRRFGQVPCAAAPLPRLSAPSTSTILASDAAGTKSAAASQEPRQRPERRVVTAAPLRPRSGAVAERPRWSGPPVPAPRFTSRGWEQQAEELLAREASASDAEWVARQLAQCVKLVVQTLLPEAEVVGVTNGGLAGSSAAFGAVVPDIDVVVQVDIEMLAQRLQWTTRANAYERKLQKAAIRACADRLIAAGAGFKFKRSAFAGAEPQVTLIAPASLGICDRSLTFALSVNTTSALRNCALVRETGRIDARARALSRLVRRWAKDRGICSTTTALSPYAWTVLAVHFLQVGANEGPLLPPLHGIQAASGLALLPAGALDPASSPSAPSAPAGDVRGDASPGALLASFFRFYACNAFAAGSTLSVRRPGRSLPGSAAGAAAAAVTAPRSGDPCLAWAIEDPFEPRRDLSADVTPEGRARVCAELRRAYALVQAGAGLSQLLEPNCGASLW